MSTIIRAGEHNGDSRGVPFNFDDMAGQADKYLASVRAEGAKLVAKAREEAQSVRAKAEREGRQAALQSVELMVAKQFEAVLPALRQVVRDIEHAKQAWLTHWEAAAVHVAAAMAARVIRGQIDHQPEVPLRLVRESLELAAGSARLRILLHPDDHAALGTQVRLLIKEFTPLAAAEVVADAEIQRGACRVETEFGVIDQQFEAQLKRIEEELT